MKKLLVCFLALSFCSADAGFWQNLKARIRKAKEAYQMGYASKSASSMSVNTAVNNLNKFTSVVNSANYIKNVISPKLLMRNNY